MKRYLITAPTEDVVTVAEARAQLRGSTDADDTVIAALIKSAVDQIDPAAKGWLGRALRPQTWELRGSEFPHDDYELPYPPLLVVDSVKYDDGDGVERTLVEGVGFRVLGQGGIEKSRIAPIYNGSWPSSVRSDHESVRIRFTAGYEDTTAGDEMPPKIKQAVILMLRSLFDLYRQGSLYESSIQIDGVSTRSFVVSKNASELLKAVSEDMLLQVRVWE